jgi:hypothetical protein
MKKPNAKSPWAMAPAPVFSISVMIIKTIHQSMRPTAVMPTSCRAVLQEHSMHVSNGLATK